MWDFVCFVIQDLCARVGLQGFGIEERGLDNVRVQSGFRHFNCSVTASGHENTCVSLSLLKAGCELHVRVCDIVDILKHG